MKWYYEADGKQQGPVSQGELDALVAEGKVTAKSQVWRDGMRDWELLYEARPELDPANRSCASCGDALPLARMTLQGNAWYCPDCLQRLAEMPATPPPLPDSDSWRHGPAWEERAERGVLATAFRTIGTVLTQPARTFSQMRREGGLLAPLAFAVLVGSLGHIATALYLYAIAHSSLPQDYPPEMARLFQEYGVLKTLLMNIVLTPLTATIHVFVLSAIMHIILLLIGGGTRTFEVTARVVCYCYGAAMCLQLLPIFGVPLALGWLLVIVGIGLARAHEIDGWQASMAILIPLMLGLVLMVGLASVAAGLR